ncbi:MAG: hypothetical protein JJT96_12065, partial [Opitutales bacterium]|nr:hypothetical protein [Opitutales bacterium]
SGFGEACAGGRAARRGIARIEGKMTWTTQWHERYRARLCSRMGPGARSRRGDVQRPSREAESEDGQSSAVSEGSGLLSKIRAFSESWVVGSVAWVESFCAPDGWLGFRKGRKAKAVVEDDGADFGKIAAAVKRPSRPALLCAPRGRLDVQESLFSTADTAPPTTFSAV